MPNLNTLLDRCALLVYESFDRFFLNGYVARFQDADDLAKVQRRAKPYIYSVDEVVRLMEAAGHLSPALRGLTYQTLIGLLAATGMRLGEAVRLRRGDIDWSDAVLTNELTKFKKSRQIPVDGTTIAALRRYSDERQRSCPRPDASDYFLVSMRGTQLLTPNADRTFHELVNRQGSARPGRVPATNPRRAPHGRRPCRPRVVSRRARCAPLLPRLSTYLGHVNPANTYWYLSAEPELLALRRPSAGAS